MTFFWVPGLEWDKKSSGHFRLPKQKRYRGRLEGPQNASENCPRAFKALALSKMSADKLLFPLKLTAPAIPLAFFFSVFMSLLR